MNVNLVQGLIDLYIKAGRSRDAVGTQAIYLNKLGLLSDEEFHGLEAALDAQDAQEAPLDIGAALQEREELRVQVDELAAQNNALQEQVEVASVSIGGGKILAQ